MFKREEGSFGPVVWRFTVRRERKEAVVEEMAEQREGYE